MAGGGSKPAPVQETTKQVSEPWDEQKEYLKTGFERAESDVLNTPTEYYGGSTVVPFSPESELAIQGMANRGMYGSPLMQGAQNQALNTIQGGFLGQNPYMDALTDNIAAQVIPQVQSQFGLAGRGGSALAASTASDAMTRALAPYAYGSYESERGRMMDAMGMAPSFAEQDWRDLTGLAQAGAAREQKAQQDLQDDINRFYFGQEEPRNRLAQYMGLIQGNYGGTTTRDAAGSVPGSGGNPLLQGLGIAASLGSMFMPSDRRVKEDVKRLGTLDNGLPVYSFRYIWGGPVHIGLMAQDVETVFPETVKEIGGIKAVNYGMVV